MISSNELSESELIALLEGRSHNFTPEQLDALTKIGAILLLEEKATGEAIFGLYQIADNYSSEISRFAREALMRLASKENQPAIDVLYQLALRENQQGLRQWLLTRPYLPQDHSLKLLLEWLVEASPQNLENLPELTRAFFQYYSPELQNTLLNHARNTPFKRWAQLITTIFKFNESHIPDLIHEFNTLSEKERNVAIVALIMKAREGNPSAFDALAYLHIHYDLSAVVEFLENEHYAPQDPQIRALYLFFTSRMEEYQQADYQNAFLLDAYQRADKSLRYRILQQARRTGQIAWIQRLETERGEVRFLADLSDAEWETTLKNLVQAERYEDLWRLAQHASPYWSTVILTLLMNKNWHPLYAGEKEGFTELCELAQACAGTLPKPSLVKKFAALERQISSLAIHPQEKFLAAGSSGQSIFVWELPEGKPVMPAPASPYPNHRVLLFSENGEYLVSAGGDHRLRVFRMSNQSVIKTFDGHRGQVRSMHFSLDGKLLYSAGFDGTVRVWRFPMGTELYQTSFEDKEIFSILPFSDGNLLAVAGYSAEIKILSLPDLRLVHTIPACPEGNFLLAGSSSSDILIASGKDRILRAWNGRTGHFLWQSGPLSSPPVGLFLHPDSEHLMFGTASGTLGFLRVSNPSAASQMIVQDSPFTALTLSTSGNMIAGANDAGIIHLWDNTLYLWTRFIRVPGSPLPIHNLADQIDKGKVHPNDLPWAKFILAFWKWISRYDVEVGEPALISVGEFDIEI